MDDTRQSERHEEHHETSPDTSRGAEDGTSRKDRKLRRWALVVAILVLLAIPVGLLVWNKLFRELPQPDWITGDDQANFLYGSIGSEAEGGIPYWIVVVLPRIFPEYLPGPGGYASLGLPWEEGKELPAGFSKKTIGFERVGFNCALCHAVQYRTRPDETPKVLAAGGNHTADIQGLLDFFSQSAADPRFNGKTLMAEIDRSYPLSWLDRLLYRFVFIPLTRKELVEQGEEFAWAHERPDWGPGRDAPMNLTKFNFLGMEWDDSLDNTDFPAIWSMEARGRRPEVQKFNLDGATPVLRSVIIDSALGLQATDTPFFRQRVKELEEWLNEVPAPKYPLAVDEQRAAAGRSVFQAHCAECHGTEPPGERLGTVIPIGEIDTDRERMDTWTQEAADLANQTVAEMGIERDGMEKHEGYVAVHLEGLWLRGPYLHNGSVPTVRALLAPPGQRPEVFYRGYDVLDRENLGFVSRGPEARREGWRYDTRVRGNGNGGHLYGTDLDPTDKEALLEYLKTL